MNNDKKLDSAPAVETPEEKLVPALKVEKVSLKTGLRGGIHDGDRGGFGGRGGGFGGGRLS